MNSLSLDGREQGRGYVSAKLFNRHSQTAKKNTTEAEKKLWQHLRAKQLYGYKFKRQQPIGDFVVDFVCFEKKLVAELDGGQHADEVHVIKDAARTDWLQSQGFVVLRFWNHDVLQNMDGVWDVITQHLMPES
ncbi:endonuclease domain-containing protein [Sulfurirhabdus autotrophica]|uniref:Very-short-patch-repair endonuclease n=1 Tax=Sulfurirhabdus autotrophica TaxID=1706046 RepID=A0A4R3XZ79_9PROT|nr:endonuclease domain-containing protein [Sulfurirhabdus autotrophica]TCV84676.1 very-short-patch-repair endonuclease [Sulfurirhabdus autotrophica]